MGREEYRGTGNNWQTQDELKFIRGLGHHRNWREEVTLEKKRDLLRGYLEGCELRARWAGLDREKIIAFARNELKKYEGLTTPREDN